MSAALRAVIFDYGKVLSRTQAGSDVAAMARVAGLRQEMFEELYWEFRTPYDRAEMDRGVYWRLIGGSLPDQKINRLAQLDNESWSRENRIMSAWAKAVRAAGWRTALLSNMPIDLKLHLEANGVWLPEFDHASYSCDVRVSKPGAAIYEDCLSGLGVSPEQALFLDDREENVEAARKLGLHAAVFTRAEAVVPALAAKFGLPGLV